DEERQLVARAESDALRQMDQSRAAEENVPLRDRLLALIEEELPREGEVALDSMASMAVQAGIAFAEPEALGRRIASCQKNIYDAQQMTSRVEILQRHIEADAHRMAEFLRSLDGDEYKPPPDMAKKSIELQRKVKAMSAQLPELQ